MLAVDMTIAGLLLTGVLVARPSVDYDATASFLFFRL